MPVNKSAMTDQTPSLTVLTEYFYPEDASTAQLLSELTTELTEDFDISVLTSYPNYHQQDTNQVVRKTSVHNGVFVERVRATQFDKDKLPLRIVNWCSFTILVLFRLLWHHRRDDALLVLSNPPVLPFAAWLNKRLTGTPYTYLIHDMYPDMPVALGLLPENNIVTRLWEQAMHSIYFDADRLVVLGESMERRLCNKMEDSTEFSSEKVSTIPNWEDGDFISPREKEFNDFAKEQGTVNQFTLVYSGNIGRFHELRTAIEAIELLESQGRTDIQLLIIGDGARKDELRQYVAKEAIKNVRFLPFQPAERLPETLTCGDASLVGIKPQMEGMCVSSKIYSSLAAGMPVMAVVGGNDDVARVVRECDCGAHVKSGDTEAAAHTLASWADDHGLVDRLGRNARRCFEANYQLEQAVETYSKLFEELVEETRS